MVTRKLLMAASAAAVSVSLLAQQAAGAEALIVYKAPVATEQSVEQARFRAEIDSYVRELNEELRTTLNESLRRELAPKVVLASNELRTRG